MSDIITPWDLNNRYVDRNTIKENGIVTVRGIYNRSASPQVSKYGYDKLVDEKTGATLKIVVPRQIRDSIKDGETVEMRGTVSDYGSRETGLLQVQLTVTDCRGADAVVVTQEEEDRFRLRRRKMTRGYRNVRTLLSTKIASGQRPSVALILPSSSITASDFLAGLGGVKNMFDFYEARVSFADAGRLAGALKASDGKYDAVCLVRGGGSGLEHLDAQPVLAQMAEMNSPTITALGHADDVLFINSLADLALETPSILGSFFKDIAEGGVPVAEVERKYRRTRSALWRVIVILAVLLAGALFYIYRHNPIIPVQ